MDDYDAIRGQLDSIILRSLLDKDEYGLEIYNNLKLLDNVMGEVKQSTFYNALKRLENASLISSYEGDISKGAKRIYYSITLNGRRFLLDEYKQWNLDDGSDMDFTDIGDDEDDLKYFKPRRTRKSKSNANAIINESVKLSENIEENSSNKSEIIGDAFTYSKEFESSDNKHTYHGDINENNGRGVSGKILYNDANADTSDIERNEIFSNQKIKTADNAVEFYANRDVGMNAQSVLPQGTETKADTSSGVVIDNGGYAEFNGQNFADSQSNSAENNAKSDHEPVPRYTSEIKLSTVIGGKYPPKSAVKPKTNEDITKGLTAEEILFNLDLNDREAAGAKDSAAHDAAYTLLGGFDDRQTIEEKQARLNNLLNLNFHEESTKLDDAENLGSSDKNDTPNSEPTEGLAGIYSKPAALSNNFGASDSAVVNASDTAREQIIETNKSHDILNKPYVEAYSPRENAEEFKNNVNYIDTLSGIYKKENEIDESENSIASSDSAVEVRRISAVNYDDYDEEKFKETSLNKLKARLTAENITLKQYVKSNTTSYYIGKYYYSNKLIRDASLLTYLIFLAMCIASHFIAVSVGGANATLTVVFSLLGAIYPIYASSCWFAMPAKRKRLPLNISMMFIASLLLYVIAVVITVIAAFFGFRVNVAEPKSTVVPLVLPIVVSAIMPLSVIIYALLFRTAKYNLK